MLLLAEATQAQATSEAHRSEAHRVRLGRRRPSRGWARATSRWPSAVAPLVGARRPQRTARDGSGGDARRGAPARAGDVALDPQFEEALAREKQAHGFISEVGGRLKRAKSDGGQGRPAALNLVQIPPRSRRCAATRRR